MRRGRARSIGPGIVLALVAALLAGLLPLPVGATHNPDFSVERLAGTGASDAALRAAAATAGYTKTVMWHVDTIDWDEATTKELILSRVLDGATSGSIVLMHLGGYRTLDALPDLVTALRVRGYRLTTISDMLD